MVSLTLISIITALGMMAIGMLSTPNREMDTNVMSGVKTWSGEDNTYVMKHSSAT